MSELIIPGAVAGPAVFNQRFFAQRFQEGGEAPACPAYGAGEVPVVELLLVNGQLCDVFHFEAFERDYLVAQLFVDAPECDDLYRSYIRYESVFRVNIRTYQTTTRRVGFESKRAAEPADD